MFNDKVPGGEKQSSSPDTVIPFDGNRFTAASLDQVDFDKPATQRNNTSNITEANFSKYRMPVWISGIAALLLITVSILPQLMSTNELNNPSQSQILKGDVKVLMPIRLQFVTGRLGENNSYTFTRGVTGRQYSESDALFLHYNLPDDGYVYLFSYQSGKGVEFLSSVQPVLQPAGPYNLPPDLHDKGISLKGVHGAYAVIGLYSPAPLKNPDQMPAVIRRAVDPGTGVVNRGILHSLGQAVTIEVIHFDVTS